MNEGKVFRSSKRTFLASMRVSEVIMVRTSDGESNVGWYYTNDHCFQSSSYVYKFGELDELAGLIKKIKRYHEIHTQH